MHKRVSAVPGRPVISNCGTPTEVVEYLDYIFKPIMQNSWSYIEDSGDFLQKIKNIGEIPERAILVNADVIGLYPSISHGAGLEALRKILNERDLPKVTTEDIVRMAEFNGGVKRQKSGTAIGTKFAPPYACIFIDEVETVS